MNPTERETRQSAILAAVTITLGTLVAIVVIVRFVHEHHESPAAISTACDCREEINAHLKNGLCADLGGITLNYRGGTMVLHGVPKLATDADGGSPPNFDGIKAALVEATAVVVANGPFLLASSKTA